MSAVLPDPTRLHIARFDKAVGHVKAAPTEGEATARMTRVYRMGGELKHHADALVSKMERGETWLAGHEGHAQYTTREDQWLAWLHEYEAVMDALERGKAVL